MNMKKTAFASALALALASSSGWAAECADPTVELGKGVNVGFTSYTCSGQFILDKVTVRAGETVNLALMGLNKDNEVDRFGEQGGSVIMGVVNTIQGQITAVPVGSGVWSNQGDKTPGAEPNDSKPGYGEFASEVRYIRLDQGNGQISIYYPPEATGEDVLSLTLQERRATANGGVEFNVITKAEKIVKIEPPSDNPGALYITKFMAPLGDEKGMSDEDSGDGIYGAMTAGVSGAEIVIVARNDRTAGPVTLTLSKGDTKLTYTGRMKRGVAKINLDSNVKLAGSYYIKAEFTGFNGNSVGMVNADKIRVYPTGKPTKLKLTSVKSRISEKMEGGGTEVNGQLLDVYGNPTSNRAGGEVRFTIKDSSGIASSSALDLTVPAFDPNGTTVARTNDNILGNATGEVKEGTISLVATAANADNTPNSAIAASDALSIKVVKESVTAVLHSELATMVGLGTSPLAGNEFKAFVIGTTDNLNPGQIVLKNLTTDEELTVNPNADKEVEALFKKATAGNKYLLSDKQGIYGQTVVVGTGISTAASTLVDVRNAHGEVQTQIIPWFDNNAKTYVTVVPEIAFKMTDAFGNQTTPGIETVTGSFYLKSSNGTVAYNTIEGDRGVPSRTPGYYPTVTYTAMGEGAFVGEDIIDVTFTKPGLGTTETKIKSPIEGINKLKAFGAYIEQLKIPVNSEVALTVEALGTDGDVFTDVASARVKFNLSEEDGLLESFKMYEVYGETDSLNSWGGQEVFDGQTLNFGESGGRKVFQVEGGPKEGKFTVTFSDTNEAGVPPVTLEFEVTGQLVEPVCSQTDPTACKTEAECTAVNGTWDAATSSCSIDVTDCSANNPSACTDMASCVATGAAIYLESYTNITDGCYGLPHEPTEVLASVIGRDGVVAEFESNFAGGVLVGDKFSKTTKVSSDISKVTIAFNFQPAAQHVGKKAHLLMAVGVELNAITGGTDTTYFGLSEFIGDFYPIDLYGNEPWADQVTKFGAKPYLGNVVLKESEQAVLVPNDLGAGDLGDFKGGIFVFTGYMLLEGDDKDKIVFNKAPIILEVE